MKIYSDRYSFGKCLMTGWEFEVLNEMKTDRDRTAENCLTHTRFLFEMDDTPLDEQIKIIKPMKDMLVRVVYSGSKSYHCIVEFDKQYEPQCEQYYKQIWKYINETYFKGLADEMCANPNRLTRVPNVKRESTGKKQELIHNMPLNYFPGAKEAIRAARAYQQMIAAKMALNPPVRAKAGKQNIGKCKTYEPVKHYIETSYPKLNGNGDSSISLFKAILCCMKFNDEETLQTVLNKARNEHWSEAEINHKIEDVMKKLK